MSEEVRRCKGVTAVYSRVTGFFSAVQNWNRGKREEYDNRVTYDPAKSMESPFIPLDSTRE
jgi:hypothetical protein